ncbi:glycoside hydrolase family 73 protein [Jeongeupia chitinilytica]|uniref:Mannosyl-glycoprotein endo-beta-N-acetylglucosamidase-like domain-containing protein n=1 Tax=Jeongeupia chitinilytica TaxID=1041641 RepID=A0ABQ3H131_9NEIS|nr:glucosaminidase domain-containing protein [Jeongeupia chitinilytica]GHD63391.1 hypothetical protein GCM10007350_20670 [Jeongeupia chitinilytica]
MFRTEFDGARAGGLTGDDIALPLSMPAEGAASFSQLFRQTQADISDFIQNGSPAAAAPTLSAEGAALLQRLGGGSAVAGAADAPDIAPSQEAFLAEIAPWAKQAGSRLGVAPELVAAHAALESGWGSRPLRQADGGSTFNLFGIKAGRGWQGQAADAATTEYVDGNSVKTTARFRAYPDLRSAFEDYAKLLSTSPRFAGAVNTGSDARAFGAALARGGYATDPAYASKLASVAARIQSLD